MTARRITQISVAVAVAATLPILGACSSGKNSSTKSGAAGSSAAAGGDKGAKIAFLMPDEASTRYEQHDRPGFVAELKKVCPTCTPLYNNATGDASKQQQQFNAALTQGAKVIVLDPVDSTAASSLVSAAHSKGVKVIAYDRPIPQAKPDFYVSFNNEEIGKSIAQSLVQDLKAKGVSTGGGNGILEVNGSPTDAAAGLIKKGVHEGLAGSGYKTLSEYDTPEWDPSKAQSWVSGQVSRFGKKIVGIVAANDGTGGGAIAALKAASVNPLPPVTGNDATTAGLQLIIAGDQYNTISKPSEIVAGAAADVAVDLLNGKSVTAVGGGSLTTVFGTKTMLFVPKVITQSNLKTDIISTKIATASQLCTGSYKVGCTKLGIS
ncbi:sugar ABC transporter substrate-binding protein [Allobranchiibius sp. GilTou38]|uniref:ABC transporter substrate-binding protein n=1 Tax=Allobranchiibius sp. GilTou38 TaxID=2815210 RepID=UPI001AA1A980|nr:sugar ABC transporter substrate-binding protein [Allobranchiibius sp. GilTou38]MBO1765947.1 sugar ABC transporter substrate-binding protein [Allobranchiibius sp. GilTou38]